MRKGKQQMKNQKLTTGTTREEVYRPFTEVDTTSELPRE
jgi:hypothetical protein